MSSTIKDLVNAKISSVEKVYDYWQVCTDKGMINIYNPVKFVRAKNESIDLEESCIQELVNHSIVNLTFKTLEHIRFELDNEKVLTVSLAEDDYTGPEAVSVHFISGEVMVLE
ncbi:MAG: hypothetical protein ACYC3E_00410 [Carboxydocellales bacterium]